MNTTWQRKWMDYRRKRHYGRCKQTGIRGCGTCDLCRWCMYMHIHVRICAHMTCARACMRLSIHRVHGPRCARANVFVYFVHMHVHVHTGVCVCREVHVSRVPARTCVHSCVYMHRIVYLLMDMYACVNVHVCIHARMCVPNVCLCTHSVCMCVCVVYTYVHTHKCTYIWNNQYLTKSDVHRW